MNHWWLISGIIGLITACIHLIGGHVGVIKPSQAGGNLLAMFIGIQFVGFSIVFLIISFSGNWKNKLLILPQWTLLLPIGVISMIGSILK